MQEFKTLAVTLGVMAVFIASVVDGEETTKPKAFVHPGMLNNRTELDFVKGQLAVGKEPWKTAWAALEKSKYASLTWKPEARAGVVRGVNGASEGARELGDDAMAAYTHALHWSLSGDPAHARKAAEILDAWSTTLKSLSGHDAKLLAGITGYKLCNAAELLRDPTSEWPTAAQERFREMLQGIYCPLIQDFFPKANGNWEASMIVTMMCMGVLCDDRAMYDRAREYFLAGAGHGALANYVYPTGQCQESTRDQAHTQLGLAFLADACEVAWKQGDDLWGAHDNRLALGFEYTARYNLGQEVPCQGKISPIARGEFRPVYEMVYHHYHGRKGLETPFTLQAAAKVPPDAVSWDHLPWGALMFAGDR